MLHILLSTCLWWLLLFVTLHWLMLHILPARIAFENWRLNSACHFLCFPFELLCWISNNYWRLILGLFFLYSFSSSNDSNEISIKLVIIAIVLILISIVTSISNIIIIVIVSIINSINDIITILESARRTSISWHYMWNRCKEILSYRYKIYIQGRHMKIHTAENTTTLCAYSFLTPWNKQYNNT